MLLVCLARPELLDARPAWAGGKVNAASVLLESLSEHDARQRSSTKRLEGRSVVVPEVRAQIAQSAQGVPLFLEQMLAMLDERPGIFQPPMSHRPSKPCSRLASSCSARAIGDSSSMRLSKVSVFHTGAVRALGNAQASIAPQLSGLARRELVRADEPGCRASNAFALRTR